MIRNKIINTVSQEVRMKKTSTDGKQFLKDVYTMKDVEHLELLALSMGFQYDDIILFKNLRGAETLYAFECGEC